MKSLDVLGLGEVPLPTHRAWRKVRASASASEFPHDSQMALGALVQDAPGGLMSAAQGSYLTACSSSASGLLQAPVEALLSPLPCAAPFL